MDNTEYINSTDYKKLEDKLKNLKSILDDLSNKLAASRKLRYAEIDIEAERESHNLQPDELYIPQHIIDTNIRREQSPYVQFVTQAPRAVICEQIDGNVVDFSLLEKDLTKKLRYDGWQLPLFATIDSMQANGYSIVEIVQDQNNLGEVGIEHLSLGEFAFTSDTKDLQAVEMVCRTYYFTKTRILSLCGIDPQNDFNKEQVDKIVAKEPESHLPSDTADVRDRSLYKVYKVMFRVSGVVNVAWCCPSTCDDWIRMPRPLFIGRKKLVEQPAVINPLLGQQEPQWEDAFETEYPYILFQYLISENDTISELKGRVFLDQDLQEAVSSLLSSTVTQARRASGLYFSKEVDDPNDDLLLQKNTFFKTGSLINSKVKQLTLNAPDPAMFNSIQMLVSANQNETSQVNFAAMNRKDSRKTAKEITIAEQAQQTLSTVQVVLFSTSLTKMYNLMVSIIKSRVLAGLIPTSDQLMKLYALEFIVRPSGGVDVLERQELIKKMTEAWGVVQNTPIAQTFMLDLLSMLFPDRFEIYKSIFEQAEQQKNSAQNQAMQQGLMLAKQMADGIIALSKKREMFSEIGLIHALPKIEMASEKLQGIMNQLGAK